MDHKAYEEQMIDGVNRNAEMKRRLGKGRFEAPGVNDGDKRTFKIGLKRTGLALVTVFLAALSVYSFIATATATGYVAVFLFFAAIVLLFWAVVFLYAQGIINVGSRGES